MIETSRKIGLAGVLAMALIAVSCGGREEKRIGEETPPQAQPAADTALFDGLWDYRLAANDARLIDSLLNDAANIGGLDRRVDFFSAALLGYPYDSTGPTGEGPEGAVDTAPLYNVSAYDCVTYIEHALALALIDRSAEFIDRLLRIRYRGGVVDYVARNHFFIADWLRSNAVFFSVVEPSRPAPVIRTVSRAAFFRRKGIETAFPDTALVLAAWSVSALLEALDERALVPGIHVVAFIKKGWRTIDANHVGIMVVRGDGAVLREASRLHRRTVELPMTRYLAGQREFLDGMIVMRLKPEYGAGE